MTGVKIRPMNKINGFELSILSPRCAATMTYKNGRLTENSSDLRGEILILFKAPATIIYTYLYFLFIVHIYYECNHKYSAYFITLKSLFKFNFYLFYNIIRNVYIVEKNNKIN